MKPANVQNMTKHMQFALNMGGSRGGGVEGVQTPPPLKNI